MLIYHLSRYLIFTSTICLFFFVEVFEVACEIQQDIEMHPFAFRTHAHKLGNFVFLSFLKEMCICIEKKVL